MSKVVNHVTLNNRSHYISVSTDLNGNRTYQIGDDELDESHTLAFLRFNAVELGRLATVVKLLQAGEALYSVEGSPATF